MRCRVDPSASPFVLARRAVARRQAERWTRKWVLIWLLVGLAGFFPVHLDRGFFYAVLAVLPALAWCAFGLFLFARTFAPAGEEKRRLRRSAWLLSVPLSFATVVGVAAGGSWLLAELGWSRIFVHDDILLRQFRAHREEFARVEAMVHEDLARLPTETEWHGGRTFAPAPDRTQEYASLFAAIGVTFPPVGQLGESFSMWVVSYGSVASGAAKGFLFSVAPPRVVVPDLDEDRGPRERGTTARVVEGCWYLFEQVW